MPVTPTFPGVYVEEIPSGVRTIVGVSTSVTAFVGYVRRGPLDVAVQLFSFADFERQFGGLDVQSEVSYAVRQFFSNGGTEAWVIRTAAGNPATAQITLLDAPGGADVLVVSAANAGTWGNRIRLDINRNTRDPDTLFNLTVTEYVTVNGAQRPGTFEVFRNCSIDSASNDYVVDKVNDGSKLIWVAPPDPNNPPDETSPLPASTGTVVDIAGLNLGALPANGSADVAVTSTTTSITGTINLTQAPTTLTELRSALQSALRGVAGLEQATVTLIGTDRLQLLSGIDDPAAVLSFSNLAGSLATVLATVEANAQQYVLGQAIANSAQVLDATGTDGTPPGAGELIGSEAAKTGLYALEDVDIFNILCIPRTAALADPTAVFTEALAYCERRRAFMIVDIPEGVNEIDEVKDWLDDNGTTLRNDHAALYFPRINIPDPLRDFRPRTVPNSGTMAGLYARIDSERGVWKAPAGTEAALRGVLSLEYKMTDPENGTLNPLGINALRTFPVYGHIAWGARTLRGADQLADEYKYVPVRRLALYIEESLFRGLKWVVFEPNDEPLWAQIRLNVGAFMHNLFRQGAFQGSKPQDAYFVKCDSTTTTQNDINLGIVNILVGFAPLKPAEFVIIKLQQMAGQIET